MCSVTPLRSTLWLGVMLVEEGVVSVTVWSVSSPGEMDWTLVHTGVLSRVSSHMMLVSVSGVSSTEMLLRLRLSSLERLIVMMYKIIVMKYKLIVKMYKLIVVMCAS